MTESDKDFGGGWNHRVVRFVDSAGEDFFEVQEVYYNAAGKPNGYCDASVCGESMGILREELARFAKAIEQPVIDSTEFNNA